MARLQTRLKVQGMTCKHCVMNATQALEAVPGVEKPVQVSLEKGEAIVPGTAALEALVAALAEEGYTATLISEDDSEAGR